jgi:hypothetical protein
LEQLDLRGIGLSPTAIKFMMESERLGGLRLLTIRRGYDRTTRRLLKQLQARFGGRLMVC